jgi:hypothetical protein
MTLGKSMALSYRAIPLHAVAQIEGLITVCKTHNLAVVSV